MANMWNDNEKRLLQIVRSTLSTSEIVQVFGALGYSRSKEAVSKMSRQLAIKFKGFGAPPVGDLKADESAAVEIALQDRADYIAQATPPKLLTPSQKGDLTKKKKEVVNSLMGQLETIRKETPRFGSVSFKQPEAKQGALSLNVLLSDWHIGRKIVDSEENKTLYDLNTATQRIINTPETIIKTIGAETLARCDEAVIILAGDMIDGEGIFQGQELQLETHAAEQVRRATKAAWEMIAGFRDAFPMVRVVATRGNHGRTGVSPEANWDNILYQQIELLVDMDEGEDLTIKNRYGNYATIDVKGWKGLIRHHAPVQCDTAGGVAKFANWHGIHDWDFFCFGHFHHWGVMTWNSKPIFRNGALGGGDEYAESLAAYDRPTQLCFTSSSDEVCEAVYPIRY